MEQDYTKELNDIRKTVNSVSSDTKRLLDSMRDAASDRANIRSSIDETTQQIHRTGNDIKSMLQQETNMIKKGINDLEEKQDELFSFLAEFGQKLLSEVISFKAGMIESIGSFEKNNTALLRNVTKGIAITEILKSAFVSNESETAIERSEEEHNDRYVQVHSAIEVKKKEFDKHLENVFISFFKQFRQIADHILDLQYNVFNRLRLETDIDRKSLDKIQKADETRTEKRQEIFNDLIEGLNQDCFNNFNSLRHKIEEDLSAKKILHIYCQQGIEKPPVLSLPVTYTQANKWNDPKHQFTDTYGLNQAVDNCYVEPKMKQEFSRYKPFVDKIRKSDFDSTELTPEQVQAIKSGLEELHKKKYLKDDHYKMISQHIDLYKISYLEGR